MSIKVLAWTLVAICSCAAFYDGGWRSLATFLGYVFMGYLVR